MSSPMGGIRARSRSRARTRRRSLPRSAAPASATSSTRRTRRARALLAEQPSRFAVIDVGTNSVKFHIAERRIDGSWHRVVDRAELTRLGEGLEATGEIGRDAIDRTADAIAQMVTEAKAAGVLAIAAVGTAGLRIARNRDAVLAEIKKRSGVGCEVVSGEEEVASRISPWWGDRPREGLARRLRHRWRQQPVHVRYRRRRRRRFSVDVGAVRYTERIRPGRSGLVRCACRGIGGDLDRPRSARRPAGAGRAGRDGWSADEHGGREPQHVHV